MKPLQQHRKILSLQSQELASSSVSLSFSRQTAWLRTENHPKGDYPLGNKQQASGEELSLDSDLTDEHSLSSGPTCLGQREVFREL